MGFTLHHCLTGKVIKIRLETRKSVNQIIQILHEVTQILLKNNTNSSNVNSTRSKKKINSE